MTWADRSSLSSATSPRVPAPLTARSWSLAIRSAFLAGRGRIAQRAQPGARRRGEGVPPQHIRIWTTAEGSFSIPSHWSLFASYVAGAVAGTRRGDAGAGHQGAGWRHRPPGTAGR